MHLFEMIKLSIAVPLLVLIDTMSMTIKEQLPLGSCVVVSAPNNLIQVNCASNNEVSSATCTFYPDTSVSNIKIRDSESVLKVLGSNTKLEGDATFRFTSADNKQELMLTIHPGDVNNQVSIFQIKYNSEAKPGSQTIKTKEFVSEKGIKLGLSYKQVIARLGDCYKIESPTKEETHLKYRLEIPNDSKTRLLTRHNMPVYYATYSFKKDKLNSFEFGFVYP